MRETDTEVVIEAELPGIDAKDVDITLSNGVLTLKGEKKGEREEMNDNFFLTERSYGSVQRSFQVGDAVEADKVAASFDKGVLKVAMPKRSEMVQNAKRIPITTT